MKCVHLPPQKVPPPGHVALPLPPELLAWSEAYPDDWPRYEEYANNCTTTQQLEALFKHLEGWSDTRPREGELKAVVEQYSSFLDKAEEEVKDMPPGADHSARFMKKLGELLASSTLTIAGKKPQFTVNDLREASNMSNAHEVTVQAVPKKHLRENMVLIVSLLNLPSTIRSTPYLTEYAI